MALNSEFKSREVKVLNKSLLHPDSGGSADDYGDKEIHDPDVSSPCPADSGITQPVERDLYDDFYPDDNPDDPDPGLYKVIPHVKKKDIHKSADR